VYSPLIGQRGADGGGSCCLCFVRRCFSSGGSQSVSWRPNLLTAGWSWYLGVVWLWFRVKFQRSDASSDDAFGSLIPLGMLLWSPSSVLGLRVNTLDHFNLDNGDSHASLDPISGVGRSQRPPFLLYTWLSCHWSPVAELGFLFWVCESIFLEEQNNMVYL
jgi:hypothetical protein